LAWVHRSWRRWPINGHSRIDSGGDDQGDDDQGDDGDGDNSGPGGEDEDKSGPGDGDDDNSGPGNAEDCTTADLTPGTVVQEAELELSEGGATFEEVELVK